MLQMIHKSKAGKKEWKLAEGAYVELASELAIGAELDIDTLVEAEPYQVQRLLHSALFFTRHLSLNSSARRRT